MKNHWIQIKKMNSKFLIALLVLSALVIVAAKAPKEYTVVEEESPDPDEDLDWKDFKGKFGKEYKNKSENSNRYKKWKENKKKMQNEYI